MRSIEDFSWLEVPGLFCQHRRRYPGGGGGGIKKREILKEAVLFTLGKNGRYNAKVERSFLRCAPVLLLACPITKIVFSLEMNVF